MVFFSVNKEDEDILLDLKQLLSNEGEIIESDSIDGTTIVQYAIQITAIVAPLISGYLLGLKNSDKIKVTHKGRIDAEITMAISKKNVEKMELAALMIKKFEDTLDDREVENED